MTMHTRFYLVHGIGLGTLTDLHEDRLEAEAKAKDQALLNPGTTFVVLEPVEAFRTVEPSVTKVWLQYPSRERAVQPPEAEAA